MSSIRVPHAPGRIRTPDQRLRVFVSSTLGELAEERRILRAAIENMQMFPVMFETGARPYPPRSLYRSYLEQSHIFVAVYWQSYGWVAPDMEVSGLEDELLLSVEKPRLIYLKQPAPDREPRLKAMLDRIRDAGDVSYKHFRAPEELADLVSKDIALLLTERFRTEEGEPAVDLPNLPVPQTRLIGRQKEVEEISALLGRDDVHLVTVTGPGGVGKTRCAIEAANRLRGETGIETTYVALDAIVDPSLVLPAVAAALGMRTESALSLTETLIDYLAPKRHLLLLDNFEQIVDAAPQLSGILAAAPNLKMLVTSRVVLKLRGEREYELSPLPIPPPESRSLEALAASPAVELFIDRARDIIPGFGLIEDHAHAVAETCRRLEGLPLAIELAAARIRLFSPPDLLRRLGRCLDELKGGPVDAPARHRALRATIEWSHSLLSEPERILLRRLAVFSDGWTIEAAERICGDDPARVADSLCSLVEKSLVRVHHLDTEARFRMLETVRAFAQERLIAGGEEAALRELHATYFLEYAERARPHLEGPGQAEWLHLVGHENENLRSAIQWCRAQDDLPGLVRFACSLKTYWWLRVQLPEQRAWMEEILPRTRDLPDSSRASFLLAVVMAIFEAGDFHQVGPLLKETVECARRADYPSGLAWGLALLGAHAVEVGETEAAVAYALEAESTARRGPDTWTRFYVLTIYGNIQAVVNRLEDAIEVHLEALELARQMENPLQIAHARVELGLLGLLAGDLELAVPHLDEAAILLRDLHHREGLSYLLDARGIQALVLGDPIRAATAFAAADHVREMTRIEMWPPIRLLRQGYSDRVALELDAALLASAVERGRGMTTDEALEFAQGGGTDQ